MRFNNAFLADLMMQGYRYIIFSRNEDVIELAPSKTPFSREELDLVNMTQLSLSDPSQIIIIENLDLLEDFSFVIDSKYFGNADEYHCPNEQNDLRGGDLLDEIRGENIKEIQLLKTLQGRHDQSLGHQL